MCCFSSAHVERVFATDSFDYVINLASETRFGQGDEVNKIIIYFSRRFYNC